MGKLNFACDAGNQGLVRSGQIMLVARPAAGRAFVLQAASASVPIRSMYRLLAAAVVLSTLFCSGGARADSAAPGKSFFPWSDGRGKVDSALDVTDPASNSTPKAKCRLPADTRFRMAPDPDSAASAPSRLVWVTTAAASAPPPTLGASAPAVSTCSVGYGYRASLPDVDSRTYYAEATIGAAVIPFKYYLSGDKSVKSNTTALGYIGLKRHTPGGDYIFGLGAGPSQISVASPSSGSGSGSGSSTQGDTTQPGFTVALVMLGQLRYDALAQFGIAVGQDRVSKSANWQNNGKWWVGFQVGMAIF